MLETLSKYKRYCSKKTILLACMTPHDISDLRITGSEVCRNLAQSLSGPLISPDSPRKGEMPGDWLFKVTQLNRRRASAGQIARSTCCPLHHTRWCPCLATSLHRCRDTGKYLYWLQDKKESPCNCLILLVIVSFSYKWDIENSS